MKRSLSATGVLILWCARVAASGRGSLLEAEASMPVSEVPARFAITVLRDDRDGVCLESRARVAVPPAHLMDALTDFAHHATLTSSPTTIAVLGAQADRFTVRYIETVPLWPDPTYTLEWTIERADSRLLLRYTGSPDDSIAGLEGFSRLEPDNGATRYRAIDCFVPPGPRVLRHRAIARALAETARDTLALFLHAEHAELSSEEIRRRALDEARGVGAR
jgi:hypothetical protein